MKTSDGIPPKDTRRIYGWHNLPNTYKAARYRITDPGQEPRVITVSRKKRQVLEGLMRSPLHSASYCRLSDTVMPLRRDHGVDIECTLYKSDTDTGRDKFGVYTLSSKVERIDGEGE
ncbi:hypothetical protein [Jannaschia sp. CCS1]|uniref:hypothetical protein n=1 Tax=Jannaschia sp. (strain CCS1) TaxID=290400 RepID=UPI000053C808|nr:hypothetical protein [Jannaschia sp. CCS1]ABD53148.1 hypothetical protein Jann_0231 [Jannaschia sp. CCS1]